MSLTILLGCSVVKCFFNLNDFVASFEKKNNHTRIEGTMMTFMGKTIKLNLKSQLDIVVTFLYI